MHGRSNCLGQVEGRTKGQGGVFFRPALVVGDTNVLKNINIKDIHILIQVFCLCSVINFIHILDNCLFLALTSDVTAFVRVVN